MADVAVKKKRTFKKFQFQGMDLDKLLELSNKELMDVLHARQRRRFNRCVAVAGFAARLRVHVGPCG